MSRQIFVAALVMFVIFNLPTQNALASCSGDQPFYGSASASYTPKANFSSKPEAEDIENAEKQALLAAWNKYISTCMDKCRMHEYLSRCSEILGKLDSYILDKKLISTLFSQDLNLAYFFLKVFN